MWTLGRVVVPEASARGELQYPFGMMKEFPTQLPVASNGKWFQGWQLLPWLAARTEKVRIGMRITNDGTPVRETIEICKGIWTNETFEYHGEFADFEPCGSGTSRCRSRTRRSTSAGLRDPKRSANRVAKNGLSGWIGIQDTPRELTAWRTAIAHELEELGTSIDDLDLCRMIWFTITDQEVDQTDNGKGCNILVGTAGQITDMLKRYQEAGLTMPLLCPPFADEPVSKTLDDLKRLTEEIMPKVEAS